MPMWRGPSEWVERRVKVQNEGESTTFMGIRLRLQSCDIDTSVMDIVSD